MTDTITFWVWFAIWPVWLVWELVLLYLRSKDTPKPKLISMVAQDMGWKFNHVVYLWSGLATHFWWPGDAWADVVTGAIFWVIAAVLLVQDGYLLFTKSDRNTWPTWLRWQRMPLVWMVVGALAGRFLFPQYDGFFTTLWVG